MALSKIPVVPGTKTLARGSVVIGNASGEPSALAIGSNTYVLKSDGTDISWGADQAGTITAFTNGVNNRVVTATSGTALNGEANLEFDGTDFKVLGKEFIGVVGSGGATTGKQTISFGSGEAMPQTLTAVNSYIALGNNEYGNTSSYNGKVMIAFGYTEGASLTHAPAYFGYHEELNSGKTKGALTFYTRSVTTDTAPTERMRIKSGGEVCINTDDTIFGGNILQIYGKNDAEVVAIQVATNGKKAIQFANASGVEAGTIVTSSSSVAYNTSSDYRLKENETPITDGITRLKTLKPYKFNFKTDPDKTVDGFFAHEVSGVIPEAISGDKDAMYPEVLYTADDELPEGKEIGDVKEVAIPNYQSIDQSKLVPLLTSALQEAITKIETLEAKVTALENA